ncbi:MAG: ABC transporter permease [Rickettsiales bacterium]|jgi:phospholipid/cholesterol/gamma-HCH transport system permease protein|nr:ABC transporter permease [Rickettsiales bacterium]
MEKIAAIGRIGIDFARGVASYAAFLLRAVKDAFVPPFYPKVLAAQMAEIGFYSLPVVSLTALFAGMVLAVQSYTGFAQFSAGSAVATVVVVSITRELGPVFAGLMVAGRIGATQAASIGTMAVTDQIDALKTLSVSPFKYIISPRILAGVLTLPFLVFVADIIGVFGGFIVGTSTLKFNAYTYVKNTYAALSWRDVYIGLVKASVFGLVITSMGCYFGYKTKGGAEGVGKSTTNAVVISSILILILNYVITDLFFEGA